MARARKPQSQTYGAQARREAQAPSACLVARIERHAPSGAYAIEARGKGRTLADYRRGAKRAQAQALRMLATLGAMPD